MLRWFSQKTQSVADGGAFESGTKLWMQSVGEWPSSGFFTAYEHQNVIGRALAWLGIGVTSPITSMRSVAVPGTDVSYSDSSWPLPPPDNSLKRRSFYFMNDHGVRSALVSSAQSVDVQRLTRSGAAVGLSPSLELPFSLGAEVHREQELVIRLNPVIDPLVTIEIVHSGAEDRASFDRYLQGILEDFDDAEREQSQASSSFAELRALISEQSTSSDGWLSTAASRLLVDPQTGPVMFSVFPRRPVREFLGILVRDASSEEVLAASDPIYVDALTFGPGLLLAD